MTIIRCIDTETTGLTPEDAVIEIGWTDIILPERTIENPKSYLCGTAKTITPENRAVHHINPTMLVGKAEFDADAFNAQCVEDGVTCLAAHNAAYDSTYVRPTLPMICTYKSALHAWPDLTKHSNSAVFYALEDQGRCHSANYAYITTHRAGPDSYVTAWILKALLEDGHTGRELLQWSKEPPLFPRCPVGKHKNKPWAEVDSGWLKWALGSDMDDDIKANCKRELDRR